MNNIRPTSKGLIGGLFIGLSFIYALAVRVRLCLYAAGVLRAEKVDGVKVVSIGNLTAGGTGKTPMAILLAKMIEGKCAVVSRGYGRLSHEKVQVVADGAGYFEKYPAAADEALLCAMELKTVPVICAPKRTDGIRAAARRFGAATVMLDDAFSHLAAHRDKNILLVDARDPVGGGYLLPAGRLREPLGSAKRADAVVITRANLVSPEELATARKTFAPLAGRGARFFTCDIAPDSVIDPSGASHPASEFLRGKKARLLSGLASPTQFEDTVEALGAEVVSHDEFGDHHPYTEEDIRRVTSSAREGEILLTTLKDLVRIPETKRGRFHVLTVSANIREEQEFKTWLSA